MNQQRIGALRRWSPVLNAARPGDVPLVLAGLSDVDLAALVEAAEAPVSLAVCEHVLARGSTSALIALARRAVLDECDEGERSLYSGVAYDGWPVWFTWLIPIRWGRWRRTGVLNRILSLRDPEVDAAVFDLDDTVQKVAQARTAILSHRKGRDGRASIPPEVKKRLLAAFAEHSAQPGAPLPPRLLSELATADDADLVLAALPHREHLDDTEKALALATLIGHGRRREVKERYPELWDQFSGSAQRAERRRVRRAARMYQGPHGPAVVTLKQYVSQTRQKNKHQERGWLLRRFALDALRTGSITAAEAVAESRPAAVALTLACCGNKDSLLPGARRAAEDMWIVIGEQLAAALGEDRARWASVIRHAAGFRGTFAELLAALDGGFPPQSYLYDDKSVPGPWNATNVLFAMAPDEIAAYLLEDTESDRHRLHDHLIAGAPLTRRLVEHVLRDGTAEQRAALAGNDATPDSVLARLLEGPKPGKPKRKKSKRGRLKPEESRRRELARIIAERRNVAPEIRFAALVRHGYDKSHGAFGHPIREITIRGPEPLLSTLRAATDPAELMSVIEAANSSIKPETRLAAYAILAEAAGPEAVWALELDRAGSLEEMAPEVRASMASGGAGALGEVGALARAAALGAARMLGEVGAFGGAAPSGSGVDDCESASTDDGWRADARLDHPFTHRLETQVRTHLDGRPERWLALVDLMTAEPGADVQELIVRLGGG